jgi:hypothetical protein
MTDSSKNTVQGSRFEKYRPDSELADLKKLEVGQTFTATLTGDHEYDGKDGPVPVLEFRAKDGIEFGWMAGSWHAREQLADLDPQDGDTVTVTRLADRGLSHQYSIRTEKPAGGDDGDFPFGA